jgi:hypothetical protein
MTGRCPVRFLLQRPGGRVKEKAMKFSTLSGIAAAITALSVASSVQAETWNARDLYNYLKRACEVAYQVEEAITDGNGNVTRDERGQVRTRMVTRTQLDYSCVPNKFSQLRISQRVEFVEVDERTFGTDYIFFNAGPVDLKCRASTAEVRAYKGVKKGTTYYIEGTLVGWEPRMWNDNFVMNCGL